MKRNILIFGFILGAILCVNMIIMVNQVCSNPEFKSNQIIGYAVMFAAFSLVFIGVRNYQKKELDGLITFWNAFKVGALIAFVASTIYVVVWLFYYYFFVPDFLDKYIVHVLKEATQNGTLEAATKQIEGLKGMYKNSFGVALITYTEVLPLGLIVALISAIILRKTKK